MSRRSAFFTGDAGRRKVEEEAEKARQRLENPPTRMPFRFFVPVGDTRSIIITDDAPEFFMYEHALKDQEGRWGRLFTGCVKTFDNCPVCRVSGKESYYAMFLSCIDLTPFTTKNGERVEFSRKLLVVKPAQQKKFLRAHQKHGTLRGAMFDMTRDGRKDPAIGNDIEFVEFVPEEELQEYKRSWEDRVTSKLVEENCSEPFDYLSLFEEPTEESLRAIVGGEPQAGSRQQEERELGPRRAQRPSSGRGRQTEDADDWEDDAAPIRPRRGARPRTDTEDDVEEEAPRSRRPAAASRSSGSAALARRRAADSGRPSRRTRTKDEEVEEDIDDDVPF